jgi:hypothetical protein
MQKVKMKKTPRTEKAKSKAVLRADSHFPFFELPAELRNRVYEYALVDPDVAIAIEYKDSSLKRRLMKGRDAENVYTSEKYESLKNWKVSRELTKYKFNTHLRGQLLRVNKQINREATAMLYGNNHMAFLDPLAMNYFLDHIGDNLQHIRFCTLLFWDPKRNARHKEAAFKKLTKAENLKSFTLGDGCLSSLNHHSDASQAVRTFYRSAYAWLWTLAARKGKDEASHELISFPGTMNDIQRLPYFRKLPAHYRKRSFLNWHDEEEWERDFRTTLQSFTSG